MMWKHMLASCCLCLALFPSHYAQILEDDVSEPTIVTRRRPVLIPETITNTDTTSDAELSEEEQDTLNKNLVTAVKANNGTELVEFYLSGGADVEYKSGIVLRTSLHIASSVADIPVIQVLLDFDADVNATTIGLATPLHVAATEGREDVVQLLLDNGSFLEAKTRNGNTPLHWAATQGHPEAVEVLLDNGADPEALNIREQKPGDILCCCECEVPNCTCDDRDLIVEFLESAFNKTDEVSLSDSSN